MADVRTYRAETMQQALDVVRRELGPDAVILHTREIPQPRFLKWRRTSQRVEVTAGTGVNVRTPAARAVQPAAVASPPKAPVDDGGVSLEIDLSRTAAPEVFAPSPELLSPPPAPTREPVTERELPSVVSQPSGSQAADSSPISSQLRSIEQMVKSLSQTAAARRSDEVPSDLFHLYAELIDGEVEDTLAQEMVCRLKAECTDEELQDVQLAKARLSQMVQNELHCSGPIRVTPGQRRTVALVGPTGVGKTTTIAKLAANFRLRDGIRMGLVTVDTYRIAAVEQLRTYAEIIDLPMKVVTSPLEMRRAMDELSGLDLVLIDTAGRSPRDEPKIQELQNFLLEAKVDEVHLVMSLVASARSLETTARQFAVAGTTSVILTKLDEAAGMGALLSSARKIEAPVSYLTTGQDVPDDIETAEAERMARLVLGSESLFDH
ncbi:Flagellar biosynthesis protein FlhF [Symmachiella dynata]|uniref:Flagellar biosynthesis protein FlhF n=1 Tax=Symmachiella dynata TaxID=2527995 RepID=A0A517ZRH5_9PLAN|nr:flagellar biosynthesis protein FlhF [Symmachiella dynata]QDU45080.1 Flagellar biosynthesis protein FlhF [Symmachiella dynata]